MQRRIVLLGAGGVFAGLVLKGCGLASPAKQPPANVISGLIDVHSHVFNGSDLPAVRFIKIVALQHFPRQAAKALDIENPDALDGLLALLTAILGRTSAPSAADERAVLYGELPSRAGNSDIAENETLVLEAIEAFHATADSRARESAQGPVPAAPSGMSKGAAIAIADALRAAAMQYEVPAPAAPGSIPSPSSEAEKAYRSNTNLGVYLRWFALFTRYRYVLAADLAAAHRRQGFEPLLLCPATVDFDFWLGEYVRTSPMPDQVAVMGALARRKTGPVVHGYVGFDPLRQAYFNSGKFLDYDPLGLVRRAIRDEGFVGVKLYPPMGFKAIGNEADRCQTYHKRIVDELAAGAPDDPTTAGCNPRPGAGSRTIGRKLDEAMTALFDLCVAESACVLAHANHTNDSGEGYAKRADPAYWLPVFRTPRWRTLRVGLAHFGHFTTQSEAAPSGTVGTEASWEWSLGRFIKEAGDPPVFADVSYLTEIMQKPEHEMSGYVEIFQRWMNEFDPECRHLMFGTDWTMLAMESSYEVYTQSVYAFFRDKCRLDRARLDRLYFRNAARFLGLRAGDAARDRLLTFYAKNNIPASRLPLVS